MALPASGQIKLSDIGSEFSASNSDLSLGGLEGSIYGAINTASTSTPDGSQPNKFSEWYSYDHSASSNLYYYNTGDKRITYNSGNNFPDNPSSSFSISLWVAPRWTGGSGNNVFLDIRDTSSNTNNRVFLQYHRTNNRIVFNRRANASNFRQQWAIHDNSSVTGISSSSTKFDANNGNKNSDGFTHLLFTYDGSGTSSNNMVKCYWNGNAMGSPLFNDTKSVFAFPLMDELCINGNLHNTNGTLDTDYDMIQIFDKVLSSTEISNLYNSGTPTNAEDVNLDTDLIFEDRAESATGVDETGDYSFVSNNGATVTAY